MPVKKKPKVGGKTSNPRPRVKPHEDGDSVKKRGSQLKSAKHKEPFKGTATLVDGGVQITGQLSELVPVADYANVQLGPVQLSWLLSGVDMEALIDVDWGDLDEDGDITFDESTLSAEQLAAYNRIRGAIRATSKVISHGIFEDRGLVEESIRLHNAREAAEEEKQTKAANKRKPRRSK